MKLKTKKAALKRFKIKGKFAYHKKAGRRHLLIGAGRNRLRALKKLSRLNKKDSLTIRRLLPYS